MNQAQLIDQHPVASTIQQEVLDALRQTPPHLPSKYFYDSRGAKLFEQICELPEYYPTRTELGILDDSLRHIADALGHGRTIVEPGSGSGIKTLKLLDAVHAPEAYIPIDISRSQLEHYATSLRLRYPHLQLKPLCADFTQPLPNMSALDSPVIWFPGSTIGNFTHTQASQFLDHLARWAGPGSELLIGVDLVKPIDILEAAYNDAAGITAEFNLNLLRHLNCVTGSNFDERHFVHEARWNPALSAIQMFLISQSRQSIDIAGQAITLRAQEAICTEYSHKYTAEHFESLAAECNWRLLNIYTDAQKWFGVFHFSLN